MDPKVALAENSLLADVDRALEEIGRRKKNRSAWKQYLRLQLIKEILIQGEYPLFESKILNAMTVYPGDVFVQNVVDAQSEIVAKLFRREGYIAPGVAVGAWEDPRDSQYIHSTRLLR